MQITKFMEMLEVLRNAEQRVYDDGQYIRFKGMIDTAGGGSKYVQRSGYIGGKILEGNILKGYNIVTYGNKTDSTVIRYTVKPHQLRVAEPKRERLATIFSVHADRYRHPGREIRPYLLKFKQKYGIQNSRCVIEANKQGYAPDERMCHLINKYDSYRKVHNRSDFDPEEFFKLGHFVNTENGVGYIAEARHDNEGKLCFMVQTQNGIEECYEPSISRDHMKKCRMSYGKLMEQTNEFPRAKEIFRKKYSMYFKHDMTGYFVSCNNRSKDEGFIVEEPNSANGCAFVLTTTGKMVLCHRWKLVTARGKLEITSDTYAKMMEIEPSEVTEYRPDGSKRSVFTEARKRFKAKYAVCDKRTGSRQKRLRKRLDRSERR